MHLCCTAMCTKWVSIGQERLARRARLYDHSPTKQTFVKPFRASHYFLFIGREDSSAIKQSSPSITRLKGRNNASCLKQKPTLLAGFEQRTGTISSSTKHFDNRFFIYSPPHQSSFMIKKDYCLNCPDDIFANITDPAVEIKCHFPFGVILFHTMTVKLILKYQSKSFWHLQKCFNPLQILIISLFNHCKLQSVLWKTKLEFKIHLMSLSLTSGHLKIIIIFKKLLLKTQSE